MAVLGSKIDDGSSAAETEGQRGHRGSPERAEGFTVDCCSVWLYFDGRFRLFVGFVFLSAGKGRVVVFAVFQFSRAAQPMRWEGERLMDDLSPWTHHLRVVARLMSLNKEPLFVCRLREGA